MVSAMRFLMEWGMYDHLEYTTSEELCEQMAAECDTAILAFSTGKDSIAAWLQMRKYFKRIVPYYCYVVPGLQFVERNLEYYEDFFGCHIYRLPHRSFFRMLGGYMDQPPKRANVIYEAKLPTEQTYNDDTIGDIIRRCENLPDAAYIGTGVRMADSPFRRVGIMTHGAVNHNAKRFYPVYDWKKDDLIRAFDDAKIKLPIDYRMFGRTFDGLDYRFLKPLQEWFPEDYDRILEWFPFAEVEIARRDGVTAVKKRKRHE